MPQSLHTTWWYRAIQPSVEDPKLYLVTDERGGDVHLSRIFWKETSQDDPSGGWVVTRDSISVPRLMLESEFAAFWQLSEPMVWTPALLKPGAKIQPRPSAEGYQSQSYHVSRVLEEGARVQVSTVDAYSGQMDILKFVRTFAPFGTKTLKTPEPSRFERL